MKTKDIIGGVSPLKQRQPSRGGKYAGAATRTAKQRGGYARSTGKRGAGGRNVGGYSVQTRFTPRGEWQKPASGGTTYWDTDTTKPGGVWVPGTADTPGYWKEWSETSDHDKLESYQTVWDANKDNFQDSYKDFETWEKEAKAWWETPEGKAERERRSKGKSTKQHKEWVEGTKGNPGYWLFPDGSKKYK